MRSSDTMPTTAEGAIRLVSVTRIDGNVRRTVPPAIGSGYEGLSMTISN